MVSPAGNPLLAFLDKFTDTTGRMIAWMILAMVLLSFAIVVLRYGFNFGSIAMQESVLYLHALVFMLGAAYTLKEDGHVRVDIFYQKMSVKNKAKVDFFGTLFLLLPFSIFIFYISFDYVSIAWKIGEKSPEAGGLPFVYLNKSFILLMTTVLVLQGVAELVRNFLVMTDKEQN